MEKYKKLTLKELNGKYWELISQEVVCSNPHQAEFYDTPEISRELDGLEEMIKNHPDYKGI